MPTATDTRSDWLLVLDAVDRLNPGIADPQSVARATGLPFARFEQALKNADQMNALQRNMGNFSLSVSGRSILARAWSESAQEFARAEQATAEAAARPDVLPEVRPAIERYRAAAVAAVPGYIAQQRQAQHDAAQERALAAQRAWAQASIAFSRLADFEADWERFELPATNDPRVPVLCLRPRFAVQGDSYLTVTVVEGGVWLRSSGGGQAVSIGWGVSRADAEAALGFALGLHIESEEHKL